MQIQSVKSGINSEIRLIMDLEPDNDLNRRDYLKGLGGLGALASTSGCVERIFGPEALQNSVEEAENNLKTNVPWSEYALTFNVQGLNLDLNNLGPTGVEDANRYSVQINVALDEDSDDIDGWLANEERAEEFWRLYTPPTYDMLLETYDNLEEFTIPNQPSNRNQIVGYELYIDAENCSSLQDGFGGQEISGIIESPSTYLEYLDGGESVTVDIDNGRFGFGFIC